MDKLAIKLKILDRYYPLKIDWDDEEKLREAAKRINDIVAKYQSRYSNKDEQDFLAMAALQFVTKLVEVEQEQKEDLLTPDLEQLLNDMQAFNAENDQVL